MELIKAREIPTLSNSGITSHQLLFPENSKSERVTVTRVVIAPGKVNPAHRHASSEQVWVAVRGTGHLLLENDGRAVFSAGDVVRFEENEYHGFENSSGSEFEYLSITSPPINFRGAYERKWPVKSEP
jgi:quercetin dioxygenase-like cupin family protein